MNHFSAILLLVSAIVLPSAVVRGQEPTPPPPIVSFADRVHHGDLVDVDVVGGFEFDWRGTITPEGFLNGLDGFNEPVYALCRTADEIAVDVARVYSTILREPKIVVRIIDRSKRAIVRMDGAVRTPTRFSLQRSVHLRELIVLAGGLTDSASGEIVLFRPKDLSCGTANVESAGTIATATPGPGDNGSQSRHIKISELLSGSAAADPEILSGDVITVTRTAPFYVIGAVNNPRPVFSHVPMTVSRAVASAGGLAKDADETSISIYRRSDDGARVIETDLARIKRGESEDEVLKQFDIVEVASKGGGKRKYPPVVVSDENKVTERPELPLRVVD